jgi:site-specific DNA-methyltransferase (adenine-specific)
MKPDKIYTGRSTIRMFNCDCMDLLNSGKKWDLAICDPEYGNIDAIGIKNGKSHNAKRKDYKVFKNIAPDAEYFEMLKGVSKNQIIWGGNFFGLSGGVIAWQKNGTAFGEGEIAICSTHNSVRFVEYTWNGMIQHDMKNKEYRIHPTQKPVQLYKWLLTNYAKDGDTILDTHGGSMSIAIACWDLGFDLDICELDTDYFNGAVKRFEQHISQTQLF